MKTSQSLFKYLDFIRKRASGELLTTATWMRKFVQTHPAYKKDSVINDQVGWDLIKKCWDIGRGVCSEPSLTGPLKLSDKNA